MYDNGKQSWEERGQAIFRLNEGESWSTDETSSNEAARIGENTVKMGVF